MKFRWINFYTLMFFLLMFLVTSLLAVLRLDESASAVTGRIGVLSMTIHKELHLSTQGAAVAVAWSADGSKIAAASNYGGVIIVWDKNGHLINQINRAGEGPALGGSLAFVNGSSGLLFLPEKGTPVSAALSIWDVTSGNVVRSLDGPLAGQGAGNRAHHFSTSLDENVLAAGTPWRGNNLIIYNTDNWQSLEVKAVQGGVVSICIFGRGRLVGVGSNTFHPTVIDVKSGTEHILQAYSDSKFGGGALRAISGSPDGSMLFVGLDSVGLSGQYYKSDEAKAWIKGLEPAKILRAEDGTLVSSVHLGTTPIRSAAWDPLGRYIAFVDGTGAIYLCSPTSPDTDYKVITLSSQSFSMAISPSGDDIAAATSSGVEVFSLTR